MSQDSSTPVAGCGRTPTNVAVRCDAEPRIVEESSPYELYIRLSPLAALWPREGPAAEWAGSIVVSCGLQAAELCLRLVDEALSDNRGPANREYRIDRLVDHLVNGQHAVHRLLATLPLPPAAVLRPGSQLAHSPGFDAVVRLTSPQLDRLTVAFEQQTKGLPYQLGIEHLLREARARHGLPSLDGLRDDSARPALDYAKLVVPEVVWDLREAEPFGPEDHLFSTAHQISECWLAIAHALLDRAAVSVWRDAARNIASAANVISLVIEAGQLLDLMVLADYHPLRVRLRDGSGAQSGAAKSLASRSEVSAQRLWDALEDRDLTLLELLERPGEHIGLYHYLQALKLLGKQNQSFLFQHYLLALSVLGVQSLGSLGYGMDKLAGRAVKPLFPRLNQAHHDYVMLTNFRHGAGSGAIIYRNELAAGEDPYQIERSDSVCPPEVIERQVRSYFASISARDGDGWVALFDPTRGQLSDVEGTRPYRGRDRLRIFINGMFNAFVEMDGRTGSVAIDGNRATVDWTFVAVSYFGLRTEFSGHEDFVFDEQGAIIEATAHWSPSDVSRQWDNQRK